MRIHRPALLVVLTSALAGLGVPAGLAQTQASGGGSNGKRKTAAHNSDLKSHRPASASVQQRAARGKSSASASSKAAGPKTSNDKSTGAKSAAVKSTGAKSTVQTSGKASGKKGSVRGAKKTRKQPGQKAPTSDRITEIQQALAREGVYQGSPNGKWDDETAVALRRFQAAHGLNANGKIDAPSLQRLGLGSQTAGVAAPTPPPGSVSRLSSSTVWSSTPEDTPRQ